MHVDRPQDYASTGAFAYQGIFGLAAPIRIPTGTVRDRWNTVSWGWPTRSGPRVDFRSPEPYTYANVQKYQDDYNHSILIGLRYAFNTAPTAPCRGTAAAGAATAPTPARTYLVFFDWDRSDLSDRARQIVAEAAQNSTRVQTTQIEVQGNADRSGTPAYNQRLSLRRAQTVAAELVRDGVNQSAIAIQAFGDTRPLVQTAAGVREPQNRRVEIILR